MQEILHWHHRIRSVSLVSTLPLIPDFKSVLPSIRSVPL
ncbi:hypothetical protein APHWI1_0795 [Anaplasma phagocytophilum str. ApWI1]|uniref:Uncharacterized protein n=2 Tax=Anaplasma phagocytophilum TaxID=948 RepID=A0A0F3PYE5_ANAPH|nr:hypothetical protein APHWEB_0724 [Anaplasma phagocytophilum str. Webster]KJV64120.1 hypothetical protein APHMUC_1069 [Anaplasma phagocytophilum str. ApMUC09]KJV85415.1 hypothetical protein APHWI1_0795 [Anaplasma phagocytophilum str. ApWI1]KJV86804.1 hypothetical protein APHNYW_1300 [Anaplasma phagocytophilum str. ApNYW]KJV97903.1 hypothetical protein OTSANNIE_1564 [Anaplasma phagocytophilum str. Annie]KJZ98356.1 hypothetical protein APHCR_0772 [Anaplasma phagocytophilum str. CR1007]